MKSKHGRRLVIGGVALVPGRMRHDLAVMGEIREQIESMMIASKFLEGAPFEWIGLVLRYGEENAESPECHSINSKDGDLPVAIEVDMKELRAAPQREVRRVFFEATMRALIGVGKKYSLPADVFEQALSDNLG